MAPQAMAFNPTIFFSKGYLAGTGGTFPWESLLFFVVGLPAEKAVSAVVRFSFQLAP